MKKSLLAATMVTLGLAAGAYTLPARAEGGEVNYDLVFKMADKNADKMVSREEFLAAMGRVYDMKMAQFKSMKDGDAMMKGSAMTREGLKSLINDIHHGA